MPYPTAADMEAVYYNGPKDFVVKRVAIPKIGDEEILVKVTLSGVCGTDQHIHEGEFMVKFPLVPGHEAVGEIAAMGSKVTGFQEGDRVVADVGTTCGHCFYCRRGKSLMCENFAAKGVAMDGGFATYVTYHFSKVFKITIPDIEAVLLEPTSCAVHGLEKLQPTLKAGSEALVIGSGPTGLVLAQLLKQNGCSRVVIASNKGIKMDLAKKLNCADEYIELDRKDALAQWAGIKSDNPYGFDIVCECTGVESLVQDSINYVRRGGTLLVYGVYENKARVSWPPSKIFGDEINIIGSFSQTYCFPQAVAYLESGKINVKGMVTDIFDLKDFQKALDCMNSRQALKIAIRPPQN